eukprot:gene6944-5006_t
MPPVQSLRERQAQARPGARPQAPDHGRGARLRKKVVVRGDGTSFPMVLDSVDVGPQICIREER